MSFVALYILVGVLFVVMAISGSLLKRLPLTAALVYLGVGVAVGPHGTGLLDLDVVRDAGAIERLTEVAVIVSLFTAGLKLRVEWRDPLWRLPLRLATIAMLVTIALIALIGVVALDLPFGAAILLGAFLAPTDPVLASDVQVADPQDRDRLRFGLTGEAGLNDGAAFPFVMLGLGLLHHHHLGSLGWRWLAIDVVWATAGGLATGALLGTAIGYLVLFLRKEHKEAVGLDDFLTLGLIALAYGAALLLHTYGFLAVFAAGLALRRIEQRSTGTNLDEVTKQMMAGDEDPAVRPETAPAYMAQAVLGFNEQLERVGEIAVVVLVGTLLTPAILSGDAIWFVPLLLLAIRPLAVALGTIGTRTDRDQRRLMAWFGIRGIGSLYYLTYAIAHGLDETTARDLASLVLAAIAVSTIVHGISVTPVMDRYSRRLERDTSPASA